MDKQLAVLALALTLLACQRTSLAERSQADQVYARVFSRTSLKPTQVLAMLAYLEQVYSAPGADSDQVGRLAKVRALLEACKPRETEPCRPDLFGDYLRLIRRQSHANLQNLLTRCKNNQFQLCQQDLERQLNQAAATMDQEHRQQLAKLLAELDDDQLNDESILKALESYLLQTHIIKLNRMGLASLGELRFRQKVDKKLLGACRSLQWKLTPASDQLDSVRRFKRTVKLEPAAAKLLLGLRVCRKLLDKSSTLLEQTYSSLKSRTGLKGSLAGLVAKLSARLVKSST